MTSTPILRRTSHNTTARHAPGPAGPAAKPGPTHSVNAAEARALFSTTGAAASAAAAPARNTPAARLPPPLPWSAEDRQLQSLLDGIRAGTTPLEDVAPDMLVLPRVALALFQPLANADTAFAAHTPPEKAALLPTALLEDLSFVHQLVTLAPQTFSHLPEKLRGDTALARVAMQGNGLNPGVLPATVLDPGLWSSLPHLGLFFGVIPEPLRSDPRVVAAALAPMFGLSTAAIWAQVPSAARTVLEQDPAFLLDVAQRGGAIANLAVPVTDKALALKLVQASPNALDWAVAPALQKDLDLLVVAMGAGAAGARRWPAGLGPFSREVALETSLRCSVPLPGYELDQDVWANILQRDPNAFQGLPEPLKTSKRLVLEAVSGHGMVLELVPPTLQEDRDVVLAAVTRHGAALQFAPPSLQSDPAVVRAAVTQDGTAVAWMDPSLNTNVDVARAAVGSMPGTLEKFGPALRGNPELVRLAVDRSPRAFVCALPPASLDRDLVMSVVARWPTAFKTLPEPLVSDLGVIEAAARADATVLLESMAFGAALADPTKAAQLRPVLLAGVAGPSGCDVLAVLASTHPNIARDRELLDAALAGVSDPSALASIPSMLPILRSRASTLGERHPGLLVNLAGDQPTLQQAVAAVKSPGFQLPANLAAQPELAMAAARSNAMALVGMHPSFLADRTIMAQAVATNHRILISVAPALRHDANFLTQCLDANPLVARLLHPTELAAVLRRRPALSKQVKAFAEALVSLNLKCVDRMEDGALRAVVRERLNNRPDGRPLAVVIRAREDHNGALLNSDWTQLLGAYRVQYHEASTDQEMTDALDSATRHQRADVLIVGGHGARGVMAFGTTDPALVARNNSTEVFELDLDDEHDAPMRGLNAAVNPHSHVVLEGCSNGEGGDQAKNLANMMGRLFPNSFIHATMVPANNRLLLDANGLMEKPVYMDGEANTYRLFPV